jgi:hypothetical protein
MSFFGAVSELCDLILSSNSKVNIAFGDEPGDVCCWKEYESKWVILDKCNIKSIMTMKLYIYLRNWVSIVQKGIRKPYLFQVVILDKPRAIAPLQHLISFFRKKIEGIYYFLEQRRECDR